MMQEFVPAKFREPTPEDLDLPSDQVKLWQLEYSCAAPRAAWNAYYAAVGHFTDEANSKLKARRAKAAARA